MFSRGATARDGAGAVVSPHREQYGCTGIGPSGFLHGDELLVLREPREDLLGNAEIGREQLAWAGSEPPGERDLFIDRAVEHEHRTAILVADILNVMPEPLRHVAYVAGSELHGFHLAVRSEDGEARAAGDEVLPFGRGGMPMQLAQRAGFQQHRRPGHRARDRKLLLRDQTELASRKHLWLLSRKLELMRQRRGLARPHRP